LNGRAAAGPPTLDFILTLEPMFMQPVPTTYLNRLHTKPLSVLLKLHGLPMSALEANHILVEQGYLMLLRRPSLKHPGEFRTMRVLTAKGLLFGKNCGSPVHPVHTSPQFYEEFFGVLWSQVLQKCRTNQEEFSIAV
jgi:hypothetical protein